MVTLSGEPPKAAMLRCVQSRAKRWSRKPRLCPVAGSSGDDGKPKTREVQVSRVAIHTKRWSYHSCDSSSSPLSHPRSSQTSCHRTRPARRYRIAMSRRRSKTAQRGHLRAQAWKARRRSSTSLTTSVTFISNHMVMCCPQSSLSAGAGLLNTNSVNCCVSKG